jgi:hypothetical protein
LGTYSRAQTKKGEPGNLGETVAKGTFGNVERVNLSKFSKAKNDEIHPFIDPSFRFEETEINLAGTEYNIKLYGTIKANFDFMNEVTAKTDTLRDLKFQVLETSFDVIIGRPEIIKYQLGAKLPRYFGATPRPSQFLGALAPALTAFGMCGCPCRDATDSVAEVTSMLGNLCGPCESVDDKLYTHADTERAA